MKFTNALLLCSSFLISTATAAIPHGHTALYHRHLADMHGTPMAHLTPHIDKGQLLDGTIQVSGFYEQLLASKEVGKFLGVAPTNTEYNLVHIAPDTVVTAKGADAINNYFVHSDPTAPANTASTKLQLSPAYSYYGALVTADMHLPFWSGWYVGAQLPVVDCRTHMHRAQKQGGAGNAGELLNYFAGVYGSEASTHRQEKIAYGLFDNTRKQQSGAPHLTTWLRKQLLSFPRAAVSGRLLVTVPFDGPASARQLAGPTLGSNGHWTLGGELSSEVKLWNKGGKRVDLLLRGQLRYVASAKEERTVPLSTTLVAHPFGQYALLTHVTQAAHEALVPAVNRLTQNITVTPGTQYELSGGLRYSSSRWQLEGGYSLQHESAETLGSFKWLDDTYRLAGSAYNTTSS